MPAWRGTGACRVIEPDDPTAVISMGHALLLPRPEEETPGNGTSI